MFLLFFFFNDTATTEIYTLSLHDALPISKLSAISESTSAPFTAAGHGCTSGKFKVRPCSSSPCDSPVGRSASTDRKSTRLNSSHLVISYAVFCLKKKKNIHTLTQV